MRALDVPRGLRTEKIGVLGNPVDGGHCCPPWSKDFRNLQAGLSLIFGMGGPDWVSDLGLATSVGVVAVSLDWSRGGFGFTRVRCFLTGRAHFLGGPDLAVD